MIRISWKKKCDIQSGTKHMISDVIVTKLWHTTRQFSANKDPSDNIERKAIVLSAFPEFC